MKVAFDHHIEIVIAEVDDGDACGSVVVAVIEVEFKGVEGIGIIALAEYQCKDSRYGDTNADPYH